MPFWITRLVFLLAIGLGSNICLAQGTTATAEPIEKKFKLQEIEGNTMFANAANGYIEAISSQGLDDLNYSEIYDRYQATYGPFLSFSPSGHPTKSPIRDYISPSSSLGKLLKAITIITVISVFIGFLWKGAKTRTYSITELGWALAKTFIGCLFSWLPGVVYVGIIAVPIILLQFTTQKEIKPDGVLNEATLMREQGDAIKEAFAVYLGWVSSQTAPDEIALAAAALNKYIKDHKFEARFGLVAIDGTPVEFKVTESTSVGAAGAGPVTVVQNKQLTGAPLPEGDQVAMVATRIGIIAQKIAKEYLTLPSETSQMTAPYIKTDFIQQLDSDDPEFQEIADSIKVETIKGTEFQSPSSLIQNTTAAAELMQHLAASSYENFIGGPTGYHAWARELTYNFISHNLMRPALASATAPALDSRVREAISQGMSSAKGIAEKLKGKSTPSWATEVLEFLRDMVLGWFIYVLGKIWLISIEVILVLMLIMVPLWIHPKTEKSFTSMLGALFLLAIFPPVHCMVLMLVDTVIHAVLPEQNSVVYLLNPMNLWYTGIATILGFLASIVITYKLIVTVKQGGNLLGFALKGMMASVGAGVMLALPMAKVGGLAASTLAGKLADSNLAKNNPTLGKAARTMSRAVDFGVDTVSTIAGRVTGVDDKYIRRGMGAKEASIGALAAMRDSALAAGSTALSGGSATEMFSRMKATGEKRHAIQKEDADRSDTKTRADDMKIYLEEQKKTSAAMLAALQTMTQQDDHQQTVPSAPVTQPANVQVTVDGPTTSTPPMAPTASHQNDVREDGLNDPVPEISPVAMNTFNAFNEAPKVRSEKTVDIG